MIRQMKLIELAVLLLFAVALTSCSYIPGYSEPENRYTVSALGFDEVDGGLRVCAFVSGKDEDKRIFEGFGHSVEYAMSHLEGADEKGIELSHCAVIIIGDSIGARYLSEILGYCRDSGDITVGVAFAAAYDAREILTPPEGDGYRLVGYLRSGEDGSGLGEGSRFYEIESTRREYGERAVLSLPYFSMKEKTVVLSGLRIFRGNEGRALLSRDEGIYYMMLSGSFREGDVSYWLNGKQQSIRIYGCRRELVSGEDILTVRLTMLSEEAETGAAEAISSEAERLFAELYPRYGHIFDLGDVGEIRVEVKLKRGANRG